MAFLNVGDVPGNFSYIRGNSFDHNFNTGIGVFGTNSLEVRDNVIYHSVGPCMRVEGKGNRVIHNMVVMSLSILTYKGRKTKVNLIWPGAIELNLATDVTVIDNAIGGSERIGYLIDGADCSNGTTTSHWSGNVVHGAWRGVHIGYEDGQADCSLISGFLTWKNLDYGIWFWPESRVIISNVIVADNTVGIMPEIAGPAALSHLTANKFVQLTNSLIVGSSSSYDCVEDPKLPVNSLPFPDSRALKAQGG